VPSAADTRREYGLVLAIGAVGAVLILLALREVWAHAIYTPPHPIPEQDYAVTGQSLIPLASALAVAALACLAAVIATRGLARRVIGGLLAVMGAYAAVTVTAAVTASAVLATAQNANPATGAGSGGGSTTGGATSSSASGILVSGAPGHAIMTGLAWHGVAAIGALAIVLAGLATVWRGPSWPVMSARFERQAVTKKNTDSATMWESLSRDVDPTAGDATPDDATPNGATPNGAGR
jgi:uncharacterized membrane protein (TIGR02234 family)